MNPKVWNKSDSNCPKDAIYIGRPSKWGNPYKIGQYGNRQAVIEQYEKYLLNTPYLVRALPELKGKDLVCWCAPASCHGDVLIKWANKEVLK